MPADTDRPFCVGPWLSSDQATFSAWIGTLIRESDCARAEELHPVLRQFAEFVAQDAAVFALIHQMLEQVPESAPFDCSPTGEPQIRSFEQMLQVLNVVLTRPPYFNKTGLTGLPINAIVDWSMATTSGYAVFLNAAVNAHLKKILNQWGTFLCSAGSLPALSEDPDTGWFGAAALEKMPNFDEEFVCDPAAPYRGFRSWDHFFTRVFRDGQRPVFSPDDDSVIANACESSPYRVARNVSASARFWIKAQPYSLRHMLAEESMAKVFEGGTIYQAFLNAFSYHRWHSPVKGTIVKTTLIEGSYYAQSQEEGFDPSGPRQSQAYITQVATRALIFIQADHPLIGLMCFMAVGMAEVSTCEIGVKAGQRVGKGDELGMFHFGGSTHCLLFRRETPLEFDLRGQTPGLDATKIKVNECIARVSQ